MQLLFHREGMDGSSTATHQHVPCSILLCAHVFSLAFSKCADASRQLPGAILTIQQMVILIEHLHAIELIMLVVIRPDHLERASYMPLHGQRYELMRRVVVYAGSMSHIAFLMLFRACAASAAGKSAECFWLVSLLLRSGSSGGSKP